MPDEVETEIVDKNLLVEYAETHYNDNGKSNQY